MILLVVMISDVFHGAGGRGRLRRSAIDRSIDRRPTTPPLLSSTTDCRIIFLCAAIVPLLLLLENASVEGMTSLADAALHLRPRG
jgi:hypothetical protein